MTLSAGFFLLVILPLSVASLVSCGEGSMFRNLTMTPVEVARADRRALGRFLRSTEPRPPRHLEPAAVAWARLVGARRGCR